MPLPLTQPWMRKAACRQTAAIAQTYDQFFGEGSHPSEAIRLCARCPVRVQCLDQALANREKYGVWGGMTWSQRDSERRRRNATKAQFEMNLLPAVEDVAAAMACTPDSMSRILRGLEVGGGSYEGPLFNMQNGEGTIPVLR